MSEDINIGDRIRELRKRRGMTQEDLAERAGLSREVIKKVEGGGNARMETYNAIARALDVVVLTFATPQAPELYLDPPQDMVLMDIRSAISPPVNIHGNPVYTLGDDEPNLAMLAQATHAIGANYGASRYDTLARHLPAVLRSAHLHVDALDGDRRTQAQRLRAAVLSTAGRYLIQIREHTLALMALRDGLIDALAVGDQPLAADAIACQAWALLRQGRFSEAEHLCSSSAEALEPRKISKASPDELSAWGMLLLNAVGAAARNNKRDEARGYHRAAAAAAAVLPPDHHSAYSWFGPSGLSRFGSLSVTLSEKELELVTGHPDKALEVAAQMPQGVGAPSGGRADDSTWYRSHLDTAKAHVETGDADAATAILKDLRTRAPEWFRYQRAAREVSEDVIASRKRMPSADQLEIADFLGVSA